MIRNILMIVICAMTGTMFLSGTAMAEKGRTLGGYRYVPVSFIEDPFVMTRFNNYTGLATASDINFPIITIPTTPPDTLFSLNGNFLFVVANFGFSYAVHPRVMLSISGGGASRVGTSTQALLSQGVTALKSINAGGLVELWRNDRFLVSAIANFGFTDGIVIDFIRYIEDIVDGNYESASLLRVIDGGSVDGGLSTAFTINEWMGLTAVGHIGASNVEGMDDDVRWRIAGSWTLDFGQRGNAPVGLALGIEADRLKPSTMGESTSTGVGFGAYYTGREDLNLGVEIKGSRLPLAGWDTTAYPVSYGLALHYYF